MDDGLQFFDIILLGLIALFIVLRLRSVLGRRDGHEGGHRDPFRPADRGDEAPDNVVHLPDRRDIENDISPEEADTPLAAGLVQIRLADPSFSPEEWLSGAKLAFEMILGAYAAGDVETLEPLLSPEVMADFSHSIRGREDEGQTLDDTLVGIRNVEIVEAYMNGAIAHVTVKFVSDQVSVLRDAEGNIVEGDPNQVTEVADFWTFARDTRSRDPNWMLVATASPE